MTKLWRITAYREDEATLHVVADTEEEALEIAEAEFRPADWWDLSEPRFDSEGSVTERPGDEENELVYGLGVGDLTPQEWWDEHERRLAERRQIVGSPEYEAAQESAGQERLFGGAA